MACFRLWLARTGWLVLLSVGILSLPPQPTFAQNQGCFHGLTPRLIIGRFGQVRPGNSNNIRDIATKAGKLLGQMSAGEIFEVLDGPKCVDALNWWQVKYKGIVGWTVESTREDYWLEPYDPNKPEVLSPNHDVEYDYQGVHFELDPAFATKVVASHRDPVVANPNYDLPQPVAPAAIEFNFIDANGEQLPLSLRIYSVDDYIKQEPQTQESFETLRKQFMDDPGWRTPTDDIPVLSIVNQPKLFRARINELNFADGSGYRFLTQTSLDVHPIINPLEYRYSGLTYDNKYYVVAEADIDSSLLADSVAAANPGADFESHFEAYRNDMVEKINQANGDEFSPNIFQFDNLIQSLQIGGPDFKVTTENGMLHAEYDNVSFDVPADFATDIDYEFTPANWVTMSAMPDHVCFGIQGNVLLQGAMGSAKLCVIPVEGMDWYVKGLTPYLKDKPDFVIADENTIIPTPVSGVRQQIQAQVRYIDTDVLRGMRFITSYSQADFAIGKLVWYNFSALTRGGNFIVFIESGVHTDLLEEASTTNAQVAAINANPHKYYQGITDKLNAGSSTDFAPNLEILDAIAQSIRFN